MFICNLASPFYVVGYEIEFKWFDFEGGGLLVKPLRTEGQYRHFQIYTQKSISFYEKTIKGINNAVVELTF